MRRERSIRNRRKRGKREPFELDITSLLDILVILLIFLLKSYNSSGLVFNVQDGIKLPISESSSINTPGIIVQVSPGNILVDDQLVFEMGESSAPNAYDQNRKRIIPLFDALVNKREEIRQLNIQAPDSKKFSGIINFVVDKTIGYNFVKKLLYTSAEAGYFQFNFVVLGAEN